MQYYFLEAKNMKGKRDSRGNVLGIKTDLEKMAKHDPNYEEKLRQAKLENRLSSLASSNMNNMDFFDDDEEAQKAIEERKRQREIYVKDRVQKL